jgi:hypothetical protein
LRLRLRAAGRIQTVPGRLDPRERTVEPRCGFGLAVPAWLGGLVGARQPGQGR